MQDGSPRRRHRLYGGIAASVVLHVVIAAALLIQLPPVDLSPAEEETVSVEIVPPPEEKAPEPEEAEKQTLDLTMPEPKPEPPKPDAPTPDQPAPDQQKPEPPKPQEQPAAEPAAPPAPTPKTPSEDAANASPPPEPQEQAEEAAPPPPPAEEPDASEPGEPERAAPGEAEAQPPAGEGETPPVMRPVFEFGEKDAGSAVARDGDAAATGDDAAEGEQAGQPSADAENDASAEAGTVDETGTEALAGVALPQDVAPPALDTTSADPLTSDDSGAAGEGTGLVAEPSSRSADGKPAGGATEAVAAKPAEKPAEKQLRRARKLFSRTDTDDPMAMAAIEGIPRDVRAGQLCSSELYGQLMNGTPAFRPDFLPSLKLAQGNVLEVSDAAFRSGGEWYDVRFRCEINPEATRVISFAFDVGAPVPRSQWKSRGFGGF